MSRPGAHDRLEPQVQSVLDGIVALPAAVMNSRYDVLAHNAAYFAMWPAVLNSRFPNLLWQSFVTPEDEESRERLLWLIDHPDAPAVDHVH